MRSKLLLLLFLSVGSILALACQQQASLQLPTYVFLPAHTATNTFTATLSPTSSPTWTPTPNGTATPVASICPFTTVTQWGGPGAASGLFNGANDITTDGSDNIYVLDSGNKRIQKFSPAGAYVTQWNDNSLMVAPSNIAFNPINNKIYVLDNVSLPSQTGVMRLFDTSGNPSPTWTLPMNGSGLAIDSLGQVYAGGQSIVIRYDFSGFNPTYYYNQGVSGAYFTGVHALAADSSSNLFVAMGSFIQKFNAAGNYILQWGAAGTAMNQFNGICYMHTDAAGNVYVVDNIVSNTIPTGRIQKFDNNGRFLCQYVLLGSFLKGITLDSNGHLFVVDSTNQLIREFTP